MPNIERKSLITPGQCRAARALLNWTQKKLAEEAKVGRSKLHSFEGETGLRAITDADERAIAVALERAGVVLIHASTEHTAGVGQRIDIPPEDSSGRGSTITPLHARLARGINTAEGALAAAYFDACDDAQAAVDPASLTDVAWARTYLAKLYEVARSVEADPAPWDQVRKLF